MKRRPNEGAGEDVPIEGVEEKRPVRGEGAREGVKAVAEETGAKKAGPEIERDALEGTPTVVKLELARHSGPDWRAHRPS